MNNEEPKFAEGDELLAILLEEYIRFYIPKGCRERISDFAFVPFFHDKDIKLLKKDMEKYFADKGWVCGKFGGHKWYVVTAVREFMTNIERKSCDGCKYKEEISFDTKALHNCKRCSNIGYFTKYESKEIK